MNAINDLICAKGSLAKKRIISENSGNDTFKRFLYYSLNPLLTYNMSEATLRDAMARVEPDGTAYSSVFEVCDTLSQMRGADSNTINKVAAYIKSFGDDEAALYIKLLSKTLRLGVTEKTVNKEIPNLIPEWEVQQGYPVEKYPFSEGTEFWLTQKLNGVRATFYNGQFYARSGKVYNGLEHIAEKLTNIVKKFDVVLDGELTVNGFVNLTDNERFRMTTGILNSDTPNKIHICFNIFDAIPTKDFVSDVPSCAYCTRRGMLDEISEQISGESDLPFGILPVLYHGNDQSQIWRLLDKMVEEDKEGLMVNLNVPYRRTRHRGILKVKRFYTMDLRIIRFEEGSGRLKGTLGAIVVDFNGNEVKVGSGFTDENRKEFWDNQDEFLEYGALCEVKYKEVSNDKKTGLKSLQFPVFVGIRTDKNEPNIE